MLATVKQWGGSKAIIVPETLASRLELNVGDNVEVEIIKKGAMSGFGRFPKSKSFQRDEKELERKF